jgi:hypothetical protein
MASINEKETNMIRPMPSPSGSNFEKLFILRGRPSPTMAYDSKLPVAGRHGLENDAAPSGGEVGRGTGNSKEAIKSIVRWACENLNDEETFELSTLLQSAISETPIGGRGNASVVAGMDAARAWGKAYGERFVRKAAKASASAEQEYHERYPHARRLSASGCGGVTSAASAKPIAADATAARDYYERFPNARRLAR